MNRPVDVTPSARRLTSSLRDIGYDFESAIADIIDNSISASCTQVDVEVRFDGDDSYVLIADDGVGMSEREIDEALRFGTRRTYESADLGKYGLGLKTASLSQCRRLTVLSRTAPTRVCLRMRTLDIDHVHETDRWEVLAGPPDHRAPWAGQALGFVNRGPGTIIVWDHLDRMFPDSGAGSTWARRRFDSLSASLRLHLGMVFHRFIEGGATGFRERGLVITINGEKVRPWNPFALTESNLVELPERRYEVSSGTIGGQVTFRPYVLPARPLFSSLEEFERLSGPRKWNRQQGLYIYRSDRMIQSGGWSGIRAIDEHTKLGRAAVDFTTSLDELFRINVAKMRVMIPAEVRTLLDAEISSLCRRAEAMYRREQRNGGDDRPNDQPQTDHDVIGTSGDFGRVGTAILVAALETGTDDQLMMIVERLRQTDPDVTRSLGW